MSEVPRPSRGFFIVLPIAIVATLGFAAWLRLNTPRPHGGLAVGQSAPTIKVQGWLNGEEPLTKELRGKVYVVHAWFPECVYCRKTTPKLIELQSKYRDQGVKFVGLTFYDDQALPGLNDYVAETKMSWLNGYGALETLKAFEAEAFPSIWVIAPDGTIVWNRAERSELEDGIQAALALTRS